MLCSNSGGLPSISFSCSSCFTPLIIDYSRSSAYQSVVAASVGGYQPLEVSRETLR